MTTSTNSRKQLPRSFQRLNELLPLRPIADDTHLETASEMADRLAVLARRSADQEDYLETLSLLIETYEEKHHPVTSGELDPRETLEYLLEEHEMSASDLGRLLGQRQLGAKILSGARNLSKAHIQKLAKHFSVSPAVFLPAES